MQSHLTVVSTNEYEVTVMLGSTEFIIQQAVDGSWMVDFYAPRVNTYSSQYKAMHRRAKHLGLTYDWDRRGSQIWITGELETIKKFLDSLTIQEEWSQYYKGDK